MTGPMLTFEKLIVGVAQLHLGTDCYIQAVERIQHSICKEEDEILKLLTLNILPELFKFQFHFP